MSAIAFGLKLNDLPADIESFEEEVVYMDIFSQTKTRLTWNYGSFVCLNK